MRFLDDAGQFGLLVSPLPGHRMFRFQIIIGGALLGDREGCILGSVMAQLKDRPQLDDAKVDIGFDPSGLMDRFAVDEFLHDAAIISSVESLDGWTLYGFIHTGRFFLLAREIMPAGVGPVLVGSVVKADYDSIVDAARDYWLKSQ
ncbi:hypothetical protein [Streptomyces sp. KLOTTS4A1]|uniref:hypothetical protein n=1 Tax=Streptomyces sp. KLOTTS4A1 TaxID=3390996 RepID=UPI0039F46E53